MVYRRRSYVRRRPLRRRYIRRVKRALIHKPLGSGEFVKCFFKIRRVTAVNTHVDAGTGVQETFVTVDDNVSEFNERGHIDNLFFQFRVCAMKIKWIPSFNVQVRNSDSSTPTQLKG
jgi:hypothetical protein